MFQISGCRHAVRWISTATEKLSEIKTNNTGNEYLQLKEQKRKETSLSKKGSSVRVAFNTSVMWKKLEIKAEKMAQCLNKYYWTVLYHCIRKCNPLYHELWVMVSLYGYHSNINPSPIDTCRFLFIYLYLFWFLCRTHCTTAVLFHYSKKERKEKLRLFFF